MIRKFKLSQKLIHNQSLSKSSQDMELPIDYICISIHFNWFFKTPMGNALDSLQNEELETEYITEEKALIEVSRYAGNLVKVSSTLQNDPEFLLKAYDRNPWIISNIQNQMFCNKDFMIQLVQRNGMHLALASLELKSDKDVILAAFRQNVCASEYFSKEIQNDREFILMILEEYGLYLLYCSKELQNDKEIVTVALKKNELALQYASKVMQRDPELVLLAIQSNPFSLKFASDELKNDKEIVLKAVELNGDSIEFASERLQDDKELVLKSLENKPRTGLNFISKGLQRDYDVLSKAFAYNPDLIRYTPGFRDDKYIVSIAVQQRGDLLFFASKDLQNDKKIVLKAVNQNSKAYFSISKELQDDVDVYLIFKRMPNVLLPQILHFYGNIHFKFN